MKEEKEYQFEKPIVLLDEMNNLQTLCDNCNLAKSNKCWEVKRNDRGESSTD